MRLIYGRSLFNWRKEDDLFDKISGSRSRETFLVLLILTMNK